MKDFFAYSSIGHFLNQPANSTQFEIEHFDNSSLVTFTVKHKQGFYEIIWLDKGKATMVVDNKEYVLSPGYLFFVSPGQFHHFKKLQGVKGGFILFTADFFLLNQQHVETLLGLSFFDNDYFNPGINFLKEDYLSIKHIIDLMYKERHEGIYLQEIEQSFLHILLAHVQRYIDWKNNIKDYKKIIIAYKRFKNLLELNFGKRKTPAYYAHVLNMSVQQLNQTIKIVTGKTVMGAIRDKIALESARLRMLS